MLRLGERERGPAAEDGLQEEGEVLPPGRPSGAQGQAVHPGGETETGEAEDVLHPDQDLSPLPGHPDQDLSPLPGQPDQDLSLFPGYGVTPSSTDGTRRGGQMAEV